MPPAIRQNGRMQRIRPVHSSARRLVVGLALVASARIVLPPRARSSPTGAEPSPSPQPSASVAGLGIGPSASLAADLLERRWTVLFVGTDAQRPSARRRGAGQHRRAHAGQPFRRSVRADARVAAARHGRRAACRTAARTAARSTASTSSRASRPCVGAMEALYGVPIDAHVVLDMDDFAALVDAVGGVDVDPPEPLTDRRLHGPPPRGRAAGARRGHGASLRPNPGRPGLRAHAAPAGGDRRPSSSG